MQVIVSGRRRRKNENELFNTKSSKKKQNKNRSTEEEEEKKSSITVEKSRSCNKKRQYRLSKITTILKKIFEIKTKLRETLFCGWA